MKTKLRSNIGDTRVKKDQMRKCQKEAKQIGPKYMYHFLYIRPDLWFDDGDLSEEESITQTFFLPSICAEKCLLKLTAEKDKFSILWRFVAWPNEAVEEISPRSCLAKLVLKFNCSLCPVPAPAPMNNNCCTRWKNYR